MQCSAGEELTLGQFALVSYIPNPLARFLDDLRVELTPDCNPRAHVTVLPPRPHHHDLKDTIRQITDGCRGFGSFHVELGEIETFEVSRVIYLGLKSGGEELRRLYKTLNSGELKFRETFPYHPHITIAQTLQPAESSRAAAIARERWAAYDGPRGFEVTRLSFVQHVAPSIWMDVAPVPLLQSVIA